MKKLLYCPMLYHHDKGMWPPTISSTAYFLWQWNLWNVFHQNPIPDLCRVLWNGGQSNSNLFDPISRWRSPFVKYTRMGIYDALKNCDVVLVDVPSTVMWDAKKEGKPCACLSFERKWVREDVLMDPRINIRFVDTNSVKVILKDWLMDTAWRTTSEEDLFVVNRNDWLEEVTS